MACAQQLGKATGCDPQLAKLAARRLMAGQAALTRSARDAVHDRDTRAVLELAHDLVAEHGARRRAAETACPHADEKPGAGRLRDVRQLRQTIGVENDRAHRRIVGGARSRSGGSG